MKKRKLAGEIIKMVNEDQKARFGWFKAKDKKKAGLKIRNIDKRNTIRAKEIIKKHGWPSFDLIGKRASKSFWLLIQHADLDLKFQEKCLKLLKKSVKSKQAFPRNEAYLTDRVLVHQGKKQKFGTQFIKKGDKLVSQPIADKKNVNKRRKTYNLDTLEENIKRMQKYAKS